jgi:glucokinase
MTRRLTGKMPPMAIYGGIDLGGTKIQAAVVDHGSDNKVLGAKRDQTPLKGGPKAIAASMAAVLKESLEEAGLKVSDLAGVGVGSPGSVDDKKGTVAGAMNLSEWSGSFNLRKALEKELSVPVALGNDVDLATDAEFEIGAARKYDSLLGVFWGTGVGGGLILDGKPWVGRKTAGEIGHMVVRLNGAKCPCGRRGCMEAYAGRGAMEARARKRVDQGEKTALFRIMEERGRDRLSSGIWERALARDDHMAIDLLEEAVEALGAGVASAVNLLDPEAVVIGGGLGIRLGEPWVERIREAMTPHLFVDDDPPPVMLAELGDLGGAHGGALLAARRAGK